MSQSIELTPALKNKTLIIDSIDFTDQNSIEQLKNIGLYVGNQIYVCDVKSNNIMSIIVDNIQYAIRISDAKKIYVRIID